MVNKVDQNVEKEVVKIRETAGPRGRSDIDPLLMKAILEQIVGEDAETRRNTAVKALLVFTWTQRLYFIVRSALMGVLGAGITGGIVIFLGEVNALQVAAISVVSFVVTLALTRLIDANLTNTSRRIVALLNRHRQLRGLILDNF